MIDWLRRRCGARGRMMKSWWRKLFGRKPRPQSLNLWRPEPEDKSRLPTRMITRRNPGAWDGVLNQEVDVSEPLMENIRQVYHRPAMSGEELRAKALDDFVLQVRRHRETYQGYIYLGDPKAPVRWVLSEFEEWVDNELLIGLYGMFLEWTSGPDGMPVGHETGIITKEEYERVYAAVCNEVDTLRAAVLEHEEKHHDRRQET